MKAANQEQILQSIVMKAWEDQSFKERLIEQPRETIEEFLGYKLKLPEERKVIVTDQTDENTVFINLPAQPNMSDVELSEDQLDVVTGGGEGKNPHCNASNHE